MMGEINITLNSMMSSNISPVIYLIYLLFEKMITATNTMPMAKSKKDPVFTQTIKPRNARPNANNPHLSLDIEYFLKNI